MGIAAVVGAGIFYHWRSLLSGRAGCYHIIYNYSYYLRIFCFMLCRICIAHTGGRQCLYLCLRIVWRIIAWIIGWDLLMEYAIGNIAVAISWSEYFVNLLEGFNIHMPQFLTMDYFRPSAHEKIQAAYRRRPFGRYYRQYESSLRYGLGNRPGFWRY
jgi:APA family basic amino acid/polyamine antiporter